MRHVGYGIPTVLFVLLAVGGSAAIADNKLYLAEYKYEDPKLYRMNLDGSSVEELSIIPQQDWLPLGLHPDPANGKIYWLHGSYNDSRIRRANLDGTGMETLVSGIKMGRGLAVDLAGGKMYFANSPPEDNATLIIQRVNIDGTGLETIHTGQWFVGRPTLDLINGKVYFGSNREIVRCNLDGSGLETVITTGPPEAPHVDQAVGVALDLDGGKIYWTDMQTSFVTNFVARSNLDDTGFEILYEGLPTSSGLMNIELDLPGGKMYWADEITSGEKGAWRANLDGTDAERIFVSPEGWNSGAIALVLEAPACGDGTCDPSEDPCSCPADCGAPSEVPESTCTDGVDNDCDGSTDCDDPDCEKDSTCQGIPTVSQWGMVIMALLLLTAGTVVQRRRRVTAK